MQFVGALFLSLSLLVVVSSQYGEQGDSVVFTLLPDTQPLRLSLQQVTKYSFTVDATKAWQNNQSAFVFQLHTQQCNITLKNSSQQCTDSLECTTSGTNVGMVTLLSQPGLLYPFGASVECGSDYKDGNVSVLAAAVSVPVYTPIPVGCSLTSSLEIDPQLTSSFSTYNTTVYFQDSNTGFDPRIASPPQCDSRDEPDVQNLVYQVYRKCLGMYNFDINDMFSAIEDMLTPHLIIHQDELRNTLSYTDPKRISFASSVGQGVIYNVLARDVTGATTAYVPVVSYACNFNSDDSSCHPKIPIVNIVIGVLLALEGLFLCFLAHRFFHVEVIVFTALIFSYAWLLLLGGVTTWSHTVLVVSSVLLGVAASLPLFLLWFCTGWYYIFLIFYGAAMGFLITATLLYTPFGHLWGVFQINYVYILSLVCGMVIFMIPLIAFPRALNIWCSSLVGSYTVMFSVSMFTYSELSEIVLRVVKNVMVPGFLTTQSDCPFQLLDIILSCVWVLLLLLSIIIQTVLSKLHERSFYRKQRERSYPDSLTCYSPFPSSPYQQLKNHFRLDPHQPEQKPLLSPSRLTHRREYFTVNRSGSM